MQSGFVPDYPIAEIIPSPLNPRKTFNERQLAELAGSIRTHGVQQPLKVRPSAVGDPSITAEIVFGERRFRAAKLAGLDGVPVIVEELTDDQVLELQLTENNNRADVHPLEEAVAYQAWLTRAQQRDGSHSHVGELAERLGKDSGFIYGRLKLLDLVEEARQAYVDERISTAVALRLARLPNPANQAEILKVLLDPYEDLRTVKELDEYIAREIFRNLHSAPFSKKDPELLPSAGACVTCPKRTGAQPDLFADIEKKDTCSDAACFERKIQAHIERERARIEAKEVDAVLVSSSWQAATKKQPGVLSHAAYKEAKASDKGAVQALVVDGYEAGKKIWVRIEKPNRGAGLSDAEREMREQQKLDLKIVEQTVARATEECLAAATAWSLGPDFDRLLFLYFFEKLGEPRQEALAQELGFDAIPAEYGPPDFEGGFEEYLAKPSRGISGKKLAPILVEGLLKSISQWTRAEWVPRIAAALGIPYSDIEKQVRAELTAKAKPKETPAAQKPSKAGAKRDVWPKPDEDGIFDPVKDKAETILLKREKKGGLSAAIELLQIAPDKWIGAARADTGGLGPGHGSFFSPLAAHKTYPTREAALLEVASALTVRCRASSKVSPKAKPAWTALAEWAEKQIPDAAQAPAAKGKKPAKKGKRK